MKQDHMSIDEYKKLCAAGKPSKMHNKKVTIDGITFDSLAESRRYDELKLMLHCGEIRGFGCQPSFTLYAGIRYRPDFLVCGKNGRIWLEDVKGYATDIFRLKEKQFRAKYPGFELRILK